MPTQRTGAKQHVHKVTGMKARGAGAPAAAGNVVDSYLAALPDDKRRVLETLRRTIRAAVPGAEEGLSYQLPTFRVGGRPLVAFGATSKHCAFYPLSDSTVRAHRAELAAWATSKGTIRFQAECPLPASLVRKLVRARVAEVAARRR